MFLLVLAAKAASAAPAQPQLVPSELSIRDALHEVVAFAERMPSPIPDLTILNTEPVPDTQSSGFGWRDDPFRHTQRFHSGTDFRADPGTPVLAAGDGIVKFAGRQGGYGNCIYIDHGGGVVTLYGHLRKIETHKGDAVTAGLQIGQVGSTGRATGPHLHFEIRLDGRVVDPVMAMAIADLQRESPDAGRLAAFALSPELQRKAKESPASRGNNRPERAARTKRTQVLW
ncbi:MAG: peptidase [Myxococcales bacterium]|nr:peptidase [Myxococcales bacterium]